MGSGDRRGSLHRGNARGRIGGCVRMNPARATRIAHEREQERIVNEEYERYGAWCLAYRERHGAGPLVCFDDWMRLVRKGKRPEKEFG